MSLLLALLSSSPAFTDQAKASAGASATALTTKAITQTALGRAGATASDTARKAVTFTAAGSLGATARDTTAKGVLFGVFASSGLTGLAVGTPGGSGITTSAAGRFGATGTAYSLQATVTTGGGRKDRFIEGNAPPERRKRARAAELEAVVAEIEGRLDTVETKEGLEQYEAKLNEAVASIGSTFNTASLAALADAERLRGLLAARELILQAAWNAAIRAEAERIEIEETDIAFVMAMLSEA